MRIAAYGIGGGIARYCATLSMAWQVRIRRGLSPCKISSELIRGMVSSGMKKRPVKPAVKIASCNWSFQYAKTDGIDHTTDCESLGVQKIA